MITRIAQEQVVDCYVIHMLRYVCFCFSFFLNKIKMSCFLKVKWIMMDGYDFRSINILGPILEKNSKNNVIYVIWDGNRVRELSFWGKLFYLFFRHHLGVLI